MSTDPTEDPAGVGRRTIMAGAAWTIPAIAIAAAAPAHAAASGTLTLAFDKSSYSGTLCKAISGAYVTATLGGAPSGGRNITVTTASGYSFTNGTTTFTGVTGSDGRLTLPGIRVRTGGSAGTITALSGSSTSTTATLTSPAALSTQTAHHRAWDGSTYGTVWDNPVPAGSTVIGPYGILTPNGELSRGGDTFATGVTSARADWAPDYSEWLVTWVDQSGAHHRAWNGTTYGTVWDNPVPAGSTVIGPYGILTPNGELSRGGDTFATGVTSARADWDPQYQWVVTWVDADGAHHRRWNGTSYDQAWDASVPTGSTVIGPYGILTPQGDLSRGGDTFATGVTSARADWSPNYSEWLVTWVDQSGAHHRAASGSTYGSAWDAAVPAGSTVIGPYGIVTPSGDLSRGGDTFATGVTSARADWSPNYSEWLVTWVDGAC